MIQTQQETVLCKVAARFSEANVIWALGGAMLLCKNGILPACEGIDLILLPRDISKADSVLSSLGQKHPRVPTANYATQYYHNYKIDGVSFTVISGMLLHYKGFLFRYPFDRDAIVSMQPMQNVYIPCTALEDWWVLYQMMPDRAAYFTALDKFISSHGIRYPERLDRLKQQPLPPAIHAGILRLNSLAPRQHMATAH